MYVTQILQIRHWQFTAMNDTVPLLEYGLELAEVPAVEPIGLTPGPVDNCYFMLRNHSELVAEVLDEFVSRPGAVDFVHHLLPQATHHRGIIPKFDGFLRLDEFVREEIHEPSRLNGKYDVDKMVNK